MEDRSRELKESYPFHMRIPTRWGDNDMLRHVNNVAYFRFIEAVVVQFQMEVAGVDWEKDAIVPVAIESLCRFHHSLSFPEQVTAGLRVMRIGGSSLTFALALYGESNPLPAATGRFVHVYADLETGSAHPIPEGRRALYEGYC